MSEEKFSSLRRLFIDAVKYGAVSVIALVVDFGVLLLLHSVWHVNYLVAATISFLLGLVVNYYLSHNRVFTDPKIKNKAMNFVAFGSIGLIGLVANDLIMWACHDGLGISVAFSKIISVVIVFFWNFLARRQFLYQGHKQEVTNDSES